MQSLSRFLERTSSHIHPQTFLLNFKKPISSILALWTWGLCTTCETKLRHRLVSLHQSLPKCVFLGTFVMNMVLGELAGSSVPHFVISVTEAGEGVWSGDLGQFGFATLEESGKMVDFDLGGSLWEHYMVVGQDFLKLMSNNHC